MNSPELDSRFIEQIVREVLATLQRGEMATPAGAPAEGPPSSDGQRRTEISGDGERRGSTGTETGDPPRLARIVSTRDGELALSGRVITLADVEDRLEGVRRVVLQPRAVVTPAVRDLLQQRGISVFYGGPQRAPNDPTAKAGQLAPLVVLLVTRRVTVQQLDNLLRPEGITAEYEVFECLIRATERTAELCRQGKLVVLVTRHVAAGTCLANRLKGVRAIWGRNAQDVAPDATSIGANVLVADLNAGLFGIKRMVRQFVLASHECPELFQEKLG